MAASPQRGSAPHVLWHTRCLAVSCALLLSGCGVNPCGSNSAAIERVRQLPEARLARLFADVSVLPANYSASGERIPAHFRDLEPIGLHVRSKNMRMVHLSGCVDDKIMLFIQPADQYGRPARIDMTLGEGKGTQVVWSSR